MGPTSYENNVLSWATGLDAKTIEQAEQAASLPFIDGHLALMPDAHFGYGSTVGSVIPTRGAIIPSAIGVDIGCGMIAAETPFTSHDLPDDLSGLHDLITQHVPAGMGKGHNRQHSYGLLPAGYAHVMDMKQATTAANQMGSLGGGNHFVEVCLDERDIVWVVLHSGSRGIGNQLANIHINNAKALMKSYFINLPHEDLAYLVEGTPDFDWYITAMRWAQEYAMDNRQAMMGAVLDDLGTAVGREAFTCTQIINCHHNFTELEHHRGRNIWITRKGAIRARTGDLGVIPGSMGAASFIVKGLGNDSSYHSCSHGAGRRMSRKAAHRDLDVEGLRTAMEGLVWNDDQAEALLDEDPRAYKDIDEVMAAQADLVTIEHRLHQILNYKGVS